MRKSYGDGFGVLNTLFTWRFEFLGLYEVCKSVQADNPDAPFKTTYCSELLPVPGLPVRFSSWQLLLNFMWSPFSFIKSLTWWQKLQLCRVGIRREGWGRWAWPSRRGSPHPRNIPTMRNVISNDDFYLYVQGDGIMPPPWYVPSRGTDSYRSTDNNF